MEITKASKKIKVIESFEELDLIAKDWNQLAEVSSQAIPMVSYAWVSAFFKERLKPYESWRVYLIYDNASLVLLLPLVVSEIKILGLKQTKLCTPYDYHTFSTDLITLPNVAGELISSLIERIFEDFPNLYSIEFKRLVEKSDSLKNIPNNRTSYKKIQYIDGLGSYIDTSGEKELYDARLRRKFKANQRKALRDLEKIGEVSFHQVTSTENDYHEHLNLFMEVEARSWKGKSGSAIINSDDLVRFYKGLTRNLANVGWLEWHYLKLDDKVIASSFSINFAGKNILWKVGYDEKYHNCSPWSVLFGHHLDRAFGQENICEIDFLSDYSWLSKWKPDFRTYFNVKLFRNSFLPIIFGYLPLLFKEKIKKLKPLQKIVRKRNVYGVRK